MFSTVKGATGITRTTSTANTPCMARKMPAQRVEAPPCQIANHIASQRIAEPVCENGAQ